MLACRVASRNSLDIYVVAEGNWVYVCVHSSGPQHPWSEEYTHLLLRPALRCEIPGVFYGGLMTLRRHGRLYALETEPTAKLQLRVAYLGLSYNPRVHRPCDTT